MLANLDQNVDDLLEDGWVVVVGDLRLLQDPHVEASGVGGSVEADGGDVGVEVVVEAGEGLSVERSVVRGFLEVLGLGLLGDVLAVGLEELVDSDFVLKVK